MTETSRDLLTGLLSARAFLDQFEAATRDGGNFVLVAIDLDRFKPLNDQFGHMAGDAWLTAVARLFEQAFQGEGHLVARYGGDEFLAAVRAADPFAVYNQAEALRQHMAEDGLAITVSGETLRPGGTISIGLATYPTNASTVEGVLEKAHEALRQAKIAGGNRVSFYQDIDPLTGLLYYETTQRSLEEALTQARLKNEPVSVLLLDIDHFKEINDEYGHRAGDEVLKRLGHILQMNFKDLGQAGRMGGDEFIVILPGQRADSAFILAEEVRRLVEDSEIPVTLGSGSSPRSFTLRFHISGGIASMPNDAAERVDLLRKAGEALYRSKQIGRNRISLPASAQMVTKTSYYTQVQLERLAERARRLDKTEAFLLREALDDLLRKYDEEN